MVRAEQSRAEQSRAEQSRAEQSRAEQSRAEQTIINYIFFFYAQYKLKKEASGGVQAFISLSRFREYLVPLPPYEEQIRIANKIEQILPLCERLK